MVDVLGSRRPLGDNIIEINADTADEDRGAWAVYEINATGWLGIEREDDVYGVLCLFLHDKGWQIDMHVDEDDVQLPPQPHFLVDTAPEVVADYVERALQHAEPTLSNRS